MESESQSASVFTVLDASASQKVADGGGDKPNHRNRKQRQNVYRCQDAIGFWHLPELEAIEQSFQVHAEKDGAAPRLRRCKQQHDRSL